MCELADIFKAYSDEIEKEINIKEEILAVVKELEKIVYSSSTILEKVHSNISNKYIENTTSQCHVILKEVPLIYVRLQEKIPSGEYYRFHWQFKWVTQRLVFITSFLIYLHENRLAKFEEIATSLGLKCKSNDGLHLDLEDYLFGILSLSSELARLSVNAVSFGDFSRPFQISHFMRDLNSAFALLNPKGDLRKRYDELKYSLKKTEEVVYNLTLRGLKPEEVPSNIG